MFTVEVRNYQSIEHATLGIEGFTTLAGRSNIGKSAFVRAVRAALTNASGTSAVRHGASCLRRLKAAKTCKCFASVRLQGQGVDLLWEKGDAVSRYTLNGEVFDRPGQGPPEFLEAVGLSPVRLGDDPICLQVADQFRPLFLLDQSGPAVAEALADVARLDKINAAVRLADKDRREVASARKVRERDLVVARDHARAFEGARAALDRARRVEADLLTLRSAESRVAEMGCYLDRASGVFRRIKDLLPVEGISLPEAPSFEGLVKKVRNLEAFEENLQAIVLSVRTIVGVERVSIPSKPPVDSALSSIRRLHRWSAALGEIRDTFHRLEGVESIVLVPFPDVEGLRRVVDPRLGRWIARLESIQESIPRYERVEAIPLPNPPKVEVLRKRIADCTRYERALASLMASIASLERRFDDASQQVSDLERQVREAGLCPTCSQPLPGHAHV